MFRNVRQEKILESHHRSHNSQLFSGQCGTWTFIVFVVRSITSHVVKFSRAGRNSRRLKINKSVDESKFISRTHRATWQFHSRCVHLGGFDPMTWERRNVAEVTQLRITSGVHFQLVPISAQITDAPSISLLYVNWTFTTFKFVSFSMLNSINVPPEFISLSIVVNANRQSRFFTVSDNPCDNQ